MTYALAQSTQATVFGSASTAAQAIEQFETDTADFFQYEITARFAGGGRSFEGYEVRIKDMDGFAAGYLRST